MVRASPKAPCPLKSFDFSVLFKRGVVMPSRVELIKEIETVPEPLLDEVMDFIQFVKAKSMREGIYTAIASESSLKKDWLCAEEDNAWADL
jgi:hypothetical protein